MMPDAIDLVIVTPEKQLLRERVASVKMHGENGYLGVLPGHAPRFFRTASPFLRRPLSARKRSIYSGPRKLWLARRSGWLRTIQILIGTAPMLRCSAR